MSNGTSLLAVSIIGNANINNVVRIRPNPSADARKITIYLFYSRKFSHGSEVLCSRDGRSPKHSSICSKKSSSRESQNTSETSVARGRTLCCRVSVQEGHSDIQMGKNSDMTRVASDAADSLIDMASTKVMKKKSRKNKRRNEKKENEECSQEANDSRPTNHTVEGNDETPLEKEKAQQKPPRPSTDTKQGSYIAAKSEVALVHTASGEEQNSEAKLVKRKKRKRSKDSSGFPDSVKESTESERAALKRKGKKEKIMQEAPQIPSSLHAKGDAKAEVCQGGDEMPRLDAEAGTISPGEKTEGKASAEEPTRKRKRRKKEEKFATTLQQDSSAAKKPLSSIPGDAGTFVDNPESAKPVDGPGDEGPDSKILDTPAVPGRRDSDLKDERVDRTVFVGNISQDTDQKDVKKVFKKFGAIEAVRIRGVIPVNPQLPKRVALLTKNLAPFSDSFQAYVVFKESQSVDDDIDKACQELNMTVLKDRHIRVMRAQSQRSGPRKQSLFIGNLPFDCSEEDIIRTFQEFAAKSGIEIVGARMNRDEDTGVGRGVGFVTFNDELGVQACLNAVGEIKIGGRVIRMEKADKMKKLNAKGYKRLKKSTGSENVQLYWQNKVSSHMAGSASANNHRQSGSTGGHKQQRGGTGSHRQNRSTRGKYSGRRSR